MSNPASDSVPTGTSTTGKTTSTPGGGGSASRNSAAVAGQGEFSSKRERDEPISTGGHQPGKLVGNDAIPEFNAKVLPAGSAPADKTFKPNPTDEAPANQDAGQGATSAADTIGGATSADVHTGLGHPGQGQSSKELRDGGASGGNEGLTTTTERGAVGGSNADVSERQEKSATDEEPVKLT
ncbi:hypothetical protein LTR95_012943 [Oleoguttula sp. CCFEE 5521]